MHRLKNAGIIGLPMKRRIASSSGVASTLIQKEKEKWIGRKKHEVDTPSLLLDLDRFNHNLSAMQKFARERKVALRPHCKTHKSSTIAAAQIRSGAVGVCTAKLGEAEVLVEHGIKPVLITSPQVTPQKITRFLACVQKDPTIMVVVDNPLNTQELNRLAAEKKLTVNVLVDLDSGQRRTGVAMSKALDFGRQIQSLSSLKLVGIQCYAGHVQHIKNFEERRKTSLSIMTEAKKILDTFFSNGLLQRDAYIFTGTGTGTHDIDCEVLGLTDMQVGSYVVMDVEYLTIGSKESETSFASTFSSPPLTLLSSVISVNQLPDLVTVDAGLKSLYKDGPPPQVAYPEELKSADYHWAGDEHGYLLLPPAFKTAKDSSLLGKNIEFIVSHCDPTINLFDFFYVHQQGKIVDIWPINMRGKSQ